MQPTVHGPRASVPAADPAGVSRMYPVELGGSVMKSISLETHTADHKLGNGEHTKTQAKGDHHSWRTLTKSGDIRCSSCEP